MRKSAFDIILKPLVTEKSNFAISEGKYTFIVKVGSTKTEIKHAVEELFQVKVSKVYTMNIAGKVKRTGVHTGSRPDWKKAIVKIDTNPVASEYLTKGGKTVTINKKYKTEIEEAGAAG
jgi:large subunit ribosomal protein L23